MPITAILADDESALQNYLSNMLEEIWPDLDIVYFAENGVDALKSIVRYQPDIVFLDINMPGLSGLEVAQQCKGECHIVFITAYDHYAIEAFDNEAIDYLLKPVNKIRLQETKQRLEIRLKNLPPDLSRLLSSLSVKPSYLNWLKVVYQEKVVLLNIDDIDYFQSSEKYTSAYSKDKEYILKSSLVKLEEKLDPEKFWRIHRSCLVKIKSIESVTKTLSGKLFINIGFQNLPVSRTYQHLFKQD